jgi:hypothetical protein
MKTKRKKKWVKILVGLSVFALFVMFMGWGFSSSKLIISYQTTRITSPLDDEGNVDYLEYLNQQAAEGVTPDNNFEYVVRKIIGVEIIDENIRAEYLKRIGLKEEDIFKKKDQFQNIYDFLETKIKPETDSSADQEKAENHINEILYPETLKWSEEDAPLVAEWLKANTHNLDLISEASKLPRSYTPYMIIPDNNDNSPSLLKVDFGPFLVERRELAYSFRVRAIDRINNKDIEGAQNDLMAIHRISRLLRNNSIDSIEIYNGDSIEYIAHYLAIMMLESDRLDKNQILSYINRASSLEHKENFTRILNTSDRFLFLESTLNMADTISSAGTNSGKNTSSFVSTKSIDFNSILIWGNEKYDALVEASKIEDSVKRSNRVSFLYDQFENRIHELNSSTINKISTAIKAGSLGNYTTDRIRDSIYVLLYPIVASRRDNEYTVQFYLNRTKIAYALKAYQLDHKNLPEKLVHLVPEYLSEIPSDPFSGQDPIYKTTEKGFLIYSVGPNQKDEKGFGPRGLNEEGDYNEKDDITIEFPMKKNQ